MRLSDSAGADKYYIFFVFDKSQGIEFQQLLFTKVGLKFKVKIIEGFYKREVCDMQIYRSRRICLFRFSISTSSSSASLKDFSPLFTSSEYWARCSCIFSIPRSVRPLISLCGADAAMMDPFYRSASIRLRLASASSSMESSCILPDRSCL